MIKRFIITIVGLYVNVLERLSKQHRQPMAVAKPPSQHHHHKHTHTHAPQSNHRSALLPLPFKPHGIAWIGANREMSLPLLLLPLRIADTDQHTKPPLTERQEKGKEQHGSSGMWSEKSPSVVTADRSIQCRRIQAPCRDHALTDG